MGDGMHPFPRRHGIRGTRYLRRFTQLHICRKRSRSLPSVMLIVLADTYRTYMLGHPTLFHAPVSS